MRTLTHLSKGVIEIGDLKCYVYLNLLHVIQSRESESWYFRLTINATKGWLLFASHKIKYLGVTDKSIVECINTKQTPYDCVVCDTKSRKRPGTKN